MPAPMQNTRNPRADSDRMDGEQQQIRRYECLIVNTIDAAIDAGLSGV
jgi:hypothetical protein